jgi:hypothetical protein
MRSGESTLHTFPYYKSLATGEESIDLAGLISKEKNLTINTNNLSGFSEITTTDYRDRIPMFYEYLLGCLNKEECFIGALAIDLLHAIKANLLANIDPSDKKIVLMSGGADSRILGWVLAEIRDDFGPGSLGEIHFVCHKPEDVEFLHAMKQQGWKPEQYRVHRQNKPQNGDYYDYGDPSYNMNGLIPPAFNFWSDIIPRGKENEWVWISGGYGGEILQYASENNNLLRENRWEMLEKFIDGFYYGKMCFVLNSKNLVLPYMSYGFLNKAFRIPDKFYALVDRVGQKEGLVRAAMLNHYGDRTPCYRMHNYDFSLSEERKKLIRIMWQGSRFYKRFKDVSVVASCDPTNPDRNGVMCRLYSLAACYEKSGL